MKIKTLITVALALGVTSLAAQSFEDINPRPQHIQASASKATIAFPKAIRLSSAPARLKGVAWGQLSRHLGVDHKAGVELVFGVRGDKVVRAYDSKIPKHSEGYYLSIEPRRIVLAGHDEQGLLYAVESLLQAQKDNTLPCGSLQDYPDVRWRGVVEGFYGTPWSYEARLSQLDFYGRNKLNVYFYGPKDDPYHSVPNWRKPYPAQEAKQIQTLVQRAKENGVTFYWAIHPGQDIKWNNEDRDLLIHKFESMYALGVRGFAVFFDDISGEGTRADKQAELLNYINREFVRRKPDVAPLVMCPTEYNKSWSRIEKGYLPTLGKELDKDIEIMWTGNTVVACIDKPDMQWINGHIRRRAYIWFNFPVSDFVRNHMLLGPTYGNSLEIAEDLSGFLSNPMEHAEASKIALYSVADYTWSMKQYDSQSSWERSIASLAGGATEAKALRTLAEHSSDLGSNGHRFRREESVQLRELLDRVVKGKAISEADLNAIKDECLRLERGANVLLTSRANLSLTKELTPWLKMARLIGRYGQEVIALPTSGKRFPEVYAHIRSLLEQMYKLDTTENQNPYQPGVRLGTRHLLPALDHLFAASVQAYNQTTGAKLSASTRYLPCTIESSIPQLAGLALSTRGTQLTISPSNEVIRWGAKEVFSLKASEEALALKSLEFDLGTKDIASVLVLEAEVAGKWTPLPLQQGADKTLIRADLKPLGGAKWTRLRLRHTKGEEIQIYFRAWRVTL